MARLYASVKDGNQIKFVPLAATLDANELAVLKVDTEISVDGATLNIDNLFIASTDGTPGNAKYIKVDANGIVYVEVVGVGIPEHWNGSVDNTVWVDITFSASCRHIQVENMSIGVARNLLVSFDGGAKYRTVQQGEILDVDCRISAIKVKGTLSTATDYEILVTI